MADVIKNRILVGHAVHHDLKAMLLSHPRQDIRDTSRYLPYKRMVKGRTPGLKRLAGQVLGVQVQHGSHSSVEDAQVTMELYKRGRKLWEQHHWKTFHQHGPHKQQQKK